MIGGRGVALSDGQRQRIGLARLFLQNPAMVVLDEALSALDPETEARVRRNLLNHFFGRSLLVISHSLEGVEEFDTLYLMEEGRLRQVTPAELRSRLGAPHLKGQVSSLEPAGGRAKGELRLIRGAGRAFGHEQ